jgi:hypothetical protein
MGMTVFASGALMRGWAIRFGTWVGVMRSEWIASLQMVVPVDISERFWYHL